MKWSMYDKEFYAIFQTLKKEKQYLIGKRFLLYFDYKTLKFLHIHKWINNILQTRWMIYLQQFLTRIVCRVGVYNNSVVDVLSRNEALLITLMEKITTFNYFYIPCFFIVRKCDSRFVQRTLGWSVGVKKDKWCHH